MISKRTQEKIAQHQANGGCSGDLERLGQWFNRFQQAYEQAILEQRRRERAAMSRSVPALISIKPPAPVAPIEKPLPPPDPLILEAETWLKLLKHPFIAVILGKRGSGKSVLGYKLLEILSRIANIYVVGLPKEARQLLPNWVNMAAKLEDVPGKSIVLIDEAYIQYSARSGTTARASAMSQILNLSRQKELSVIFVTQESRQVDLRILSSANVVIFKELSLLQLKFDRKELNEIETKAKEAFATVTGEKRKWSYVYSPDCDFMGLVENSMPTFWNEKLSHIFAIEGDPIASAPKNIALSEKIEKAKELSRQNKSQGQISREMHVSRPTIKNWLEDYPYKREPKHQV